MGLRRDHSISSSLPTSAHQETVNSFKGIEAMIGSMTPFERANPDSIDQNRRKRIAKGSGKEIAEVNAFMKQFEQMKQMMKTMNKMPMGGMGLGKR